MITPFLAKKGEDKAGFPPLYNTIIGGIGATTVSSASDLETILGLLPGNVSFFEIQPGTNDVYAYIDVSYTIPEAAFEGNTEITSYEDIDGLVTTIEYEAFRYSTLAGDISFPNCTTLTTGPFKEGGHFRSTNITSFHSACPIVPFYCFLQCSNLTEVTSSVPITLIQEYAFQDSAIETIDLSSVETLQLYAFRNCAGMTGTVNLPALTSTHDAFIQCANLTGFTAPLLTTLDDSFAQTGLLSVNLDVDAPNITTLTGNAFSSCANMTSFIANNVTTANGWSTFAACSSLIYIELGSCTQYATTTGLDYFFGNPSNPSSELPMGGDIVVNSFVLTSNGGGLEGDLDYLVNTRGWSYTVAP